MIERFEKFSIAISDISRYWHKISADEMSKYGLKGSHATYLTVMSRFPEGITATQLCDLCGKDKSDVSRMMSILERKGLVTKEGIHQNLYKGSFKLTEEGKTAADEVQKRAVLAVTLAGEDVSEEERAIFYKVLGSIAENLSKLSRDGLPEDQL